MTDEQKIIITEYISLKLTEIGKAAFEPNNYYEYLLDNWDEFSDFNTINLIVTTKRQADKEVAISSLKASLISLDPTYQDKLK